MLTLSKLYKFDEYCANSSIHAWYGRAWPGPPIVLTHYKIIITFAHNDIRRRQCCRSLDINVHLFSFQLGILAGIKRNGFRLLISFLDSFVVGRIVYLLAWLSWWWRRRDIDRFVHHTCWYKPSSKTRLWSFYCEHHDSGRSRWILYLLIASAPKKMIACTPSHSLLNDKWVASFPW